MATTTPLPASLQTQGSISKRIISDHRAFFNLYDQYKTESNPEMRDRIANTIIREVAIHSTAEEVVVYPVIEKNFENGRDHAQRLRAEHQDVKNDLYNFDSTKDPGLLSKIMSELRKHIEYEEGQEIPMLMSKLSTSEDQSLVTQWDKTRTTVPTRPHPSAPDKGGLTKAAAGMASKPLDLLMDTTRQYVDVPRGE